MWMKNQPRKFNVKVLGTGKLELSRLFIAA
jgi:hypothetical protein